MTKSDEVREEKDDGCSVKNIKMEEAARAILSMFPADVKAADSGQVLKTPAS